MSELTRCAILASSRPEKVSAVLNGFCRDLLREGSLRVHIDASFHCQSEKIASTVGRRELFDFLLSGSRSEPESEAAAKTRNHSAPNEKVFRSRCRSHRSRGSDHDPQFPRQASFCSFLLLLLLRLWLSTLRLSSRSL